VPDDPRPSADAPTELSHAAAVHRNAKTAPPLDRRAERVIDPRIEGTPEATENEASPDNADTADGGPKGGGGMPLPWTPILPDGIDGPIPATIGLLPPGDPAGPGNPTVTGPAGPD